MAHYVLPQKSINYLISRNYSIGEIWTNLKDNGITYCKVLPIKEPLEMQHCWQAMGFSNTHIQVYISPLSTSESLLDAAGLVNDTSFNSVYERIKESRRDKPNPLGIWRHKPKGLNKSKKWMARDKKVKQRKWTQFSTLFDLCSKYHLRFDYISKQFDDGVNVFCTSNNILIKRAS